MTIYRNPVIDFATITNTQRYVAIQSRKYNSDILEERRKHHAN